MTRSRLGKALLISAVAAALFAIVRAVRGEPAPAFELPGGAGTPWPTLRAETTPDWAGPAAAPPDAAPLADAPVTDAPVTDAQANDSAPAGEAPFVELRFPEGTVDGDAEGSSWVAATGAPPPATHPVKAKLGSGIYHLPGMINYDRTRPDRYYRTAADAEADGLRAAKR